MVTSPLMSGSCPYTSHSIAKTSLLATPTEKPGTTTQTHFDGSIQECTSFSQLNIGIPGSVCVGPTIYTPAPAPAAIQTSTTVPESPSTSVVPSPKASCDLTVSHDGDSWILQGRGWTTSKLKMHLKACGSVKQWNLEELTNDPNAWEFRASFHMNEDYDVCIKNSIDETANC